MENFKIYKNGKYDIKANMSIKLGKFVTVLDRAQTAIFVEHRLGSLDLDSITL